MLLAFLNSVVLENDNKTKNRKNLGSDDDVFEDGYTIGEGMYFKPASKDNLSEDEEGAGADELGEDLEEEESDDFGETEE